MSGRYARTYSRKKQPQPPISQFDRLVSDPGKSAHPVAAKTAGHVGKWGITSFTSLRCINGSYESSKRSWPDSSPPPYNELSSNVDVSNGSGTISAPVKKKKFFKSRNETSDVPSPVSRSNSTDCPNTNITEQIPAKTKAPQSTISFDDVSSDVNKFPAFPPFKGKTDICPTVKTSGGIKLKIFKSRNSESSLEYSSTVELPSDDSRVSSNSSSVCSSPRLEDDQCSSEIPNKKSTNGEVPAQKSKIIPTNLSEKEESQPSNDEESRPTLPPSVPINNSFDSSFEFGVLIDQRTGLPISPPTPQKDGLEPLSAKTTLHVGLDSPSVESSHSPKINNTKDIDLDNDPPQSEVLPVQNTKQVSGNSSPNIVPKQSEKSSKGENLESNKENKDNFNPQRDCAIDLFSTDFDENEIVDRTSIDYSSSGLTESLSRSDTYELLDLWGTQNSQSGASSDLPNSQSDEGKLPTNNPKLSTKRSIFKSRSKDEKVKKRATYIHKWHNHEEKDEDGFKRENSEKRSAAPSTGSASDPFEFDTTPELKRIHTWPQANQDAYNASFEESQTITSVKCPKEAKRFYTVVKNVKKTHQLQESGEFQEFNDDVEYFLDALKSSNSISTRCLAALNLAQKCMVPAFRMHLRAHGTVTKFFRALFDAPSHSKLSESAAMVMFALSQDRLNMDLDRDSLELMLNLLDTEARPASLNEDSAFSEASLADHNSRIRSLCEELKQKGLAKHLKLEHIDAATLAMETLLSLTSKRAGEWFKEELRMLGGVDHLIRTVTSCIDYFNPSIQLWNSSLLEKLTKAERCLKVLENITHQNEANQEYLLKQSEPAFGKTLMRLFRLCHIEIPLNPERADGQITVIPPNPSTIKGLITTLVTTMKVLINLTHNSKKEAIGSKLLGNNDEIYVISLYCLLVMPDYLNHDTKFEIQVLACCLLLNLVENSVSNRNCLMSMKSPISHPDEDDLFRVPKEGSAMQALISLFYSCEESAREQEAHTDHIIENDLDQESNKDEEKKDDDIEETVARLLQKAGMHMEDTLIAAYTALLAGFCLMDNKEFEEQIRLMQPEGNFKTMVAVLKKFFHFMNLTATTALMRSLKPTECVLKYMEKLDKPPEPKNSKKQENSNTIDKSLETLDAFGF